MGSDGSCWTRAAVSHHVIDEGAVNQQKHMGAAKAAAKHLREVKLEREDVAVEGGLTGTSIWLPATAKYFIRLEFFTRPDAQRGKTLSLLYFWLAGRQAGWPGPN